MNYIESRLKPYAEAVLRDLERGRDPTHSAVNLLAIAAILHKNADLQDLVEAELAPCWKKDARGRDVVDNTDYARAVLHVVRNLEAPAS